MIESSPPSNRTSSPYDQLHSSFLTLRPLLLAQLQANAAARALGPMVYDLFAEWAMQGEGTVGLLQVQRVAERYHLQAELSEPLLPVGFAGQDHLPHLLEILLSKKPAWMGLFLVEALYAQGLLQRLRSLHEPERGPELIRAAQTVVACERLGSYALYRFMDVVCAPREAIAFWRAWREAWGSQDPPRRDVSFCKLLSRELKNLIELWGFDEPVRQTSEAGPGESIVGMSGLLGSMEVSQASIPVTETGIFRAFCSAPTTETGSFAGITDAIRAQMAKKESESDFASVVVTPPPPPQPFTPAMEAALKQTARERERIDAQAREHQRPRPVSQKKASAKPQRIPVKKDWRIPGARGLSWLVWGFCALWAGYGIFKGISGQADIWTGVGLFAAGGALWAIFESSAR